MGEIRFDQELHDFGQRCHVRNTQLSQSLAWWVAAELVRRHPDELRVIETHPGGGFYNCISVYRVDVGEQPAVVVHMNIDAGAHLTHNSWFSSSVESRRLNWLEVLLCEDRRTYVIEQLESVEVLGSPRATPSTQVSSVGPMVISAFLERSVFGPARWAAANGAEDGNYGASVRTSLFDQVPGAAQWAASEPGDISGHSEYRFWFVGPRGDGEFSVERVGFAVDTWTGHLWRPGSEDPVDLMATYQTVARSLDALVSAVCPPSF